MRRSSSLSPEACEHQLNIWSFLVLAAGALRSAIELFQRIKTIEQLTSKIQDEIIILHMFCGLRKTFQIVDLLKEMSIECCSMKGMRENEKILYSRLE